MNKENKLQASLPKGFKDRWGDELALKNNFTADKAFNFNEALKKISSKERKLIVCFGSLYNVGNILNKN